MPYSMQHHNGSQLVAIDCETTGLDSCWHELIQIAIIPLDSYIKPRKDVLPFYINLIPDEPERADLEALRTSKIKIEDLNTTGHDREKAKDLLEHWKTKLGLPYTKYGNPKKLIPLGHNYVFDMGFIKKWLGLDLYDEIFEPFYRDTFLVGAYLNDKAAMHTETVPYNKLNLTWMCKQHNVKIERAHDALSDAAASAELYRKLTQSGLLE